MKIYNTTSPQQNIKSNNKQVTFQSYKGIKNKNFFNAHYQKLLEEKFLDTFTNNHNCHRFLNMNDLQVLLESKTVYDDLYGKHTKSTLKLLSKPIKCGRWSEIRNKLTQYKTIYETSFENGQAQISVERVLFEQVLNDFDSIIKYLLKK